MRTGATSKFQAGLAVTLISARSECRLSVPWQSDSHLSGVAGPSPSWSRGENRISGPTVILGEGLLPAFLWVLGVTPEMACWKKRQQCSLHAGGRIICDYSYFYGLRWLLAAVGSLWSAAGQTCLWEGAQGASAPSSHPIFVLFPMC